MHSLIYSPAGLVIRLLVGVTIFAILATIDYRNNGPAATRWKEYTVLLAAVGMALIYGVANDLFTSKISPEYFLYGKELYRTIGDNPPVSVLRWEAAKIGLMATWSAGLLFGVAVLLANNPWKNLPRLRNRTLIGLLPIIPAAAAILGVVGGLMGYRGWMTNWQSDFVMMVDANIYRPYRFMATWGVHLGGYAGGLIGTIVVVGIVVRRRINLRGRLWEQTGQSSAAGSLDKGR